MKDKIDDVIEDGLNEVNRAPQMKKAKAFPEVSIAPGITAKSVVHDPRALMLDSPTQYLVTISARGVEKTLVVDVDRGTIKFYR